MNSFIFGLALCAAGAVGDRAPAAPNSDYLVLCWTHEEPAHQGEIRCTEVRPGVSGIEVRDEILTVHNSLQVPKKLEIVIDPQTRQANVVVAIPSALRQVSLANPETWSNLVVESGINVLTGLRHTRDWTYWTNRSDHSVKKVARTGGVVELVVQADIGCTPQDVAIDDVQGYGYFVCGQSDEVMSWALGNSTPEIFVPSCAPEQTSETCNRRNPASVVVDRQRNLLIWVASNDDFAFVRELRGTEQSLENRTPQYIFSLEAPAAMRAITLGPGGKRLFGTNQSLNYPGEGLPAEPIGRMIYFVDLDEALAHSVDESYYAETDAVTKDALGSALRSRVRVLLPRPGEDENIVGNVHGIAVAPFPKILSSYPPRGSISAWFPGRTLGWQQITLTLERPTLLPVLAEDFELTVARNAPSPSRVQRGIHANADMPSILDIEQDPLDKRQVTLFFDRPIPPWAWTTVHYLPSNSKVHLGHLPGDVDGNSLIDEQDFITLFNSVYGLGNVVKLSPWQIDIDGSNTLYGGDSTLADESDLEMLLEILSRWHGQTLPLLCYD